MSKSTETKIKDEIEISHRSEKDIAYQVGKIAMELNHCGESKRDEIKAAAAEAGKRLNAHERGQATGIHSWETHDKFQTDNKILAGWCRSEFGIKYIGQITPEMVGGFLTRLSELGYAKNTINGYCTQAEKLAAALGKGDSWHNAIKEYKSSGVYAGVEEKDTSHRAYDNPREIIAAIGNEKAQVAASLALNYGLRKSDCCHFRLDEQKLLVNSKNGMKTTHFLNPAEATRIKPFLNEGGRFNLSQNTLDKAFRSACAKVGEVCNGLHGLRHNYAQGSYISHRASGMSHDASMLATAEEMNHSRPGITETYLR